MARIVCRFSCGAASAVATKLTLAKYGPDRVVITYSNPGSEHPDNKRFMADCAAWFGQPIIVLANGKYADTWDVWEKERFIAPCSERRSHPSENYRRETRPSPRPPIKGQSRMTIHYHGMPLTPEVMLLDLAGKHACISFATKRDRQVETCLRLMQSIMFDNGAFTVHQQGGKLDMHAYYAWLRPMLRHPHWAVVPDVIDGTVDQQRSLRATWPFPKALGAPVWHLGLPLEYLVELAREWPRICLGSSGQYWSVGTAPWAARMHQAFGALEEADLHPMIHGLRMMDQAGDWPLASVDSANVARNYKDREDMPGRMADRLDRVNAPLNFLPQRTLFDAA